jgi:hypothetical protein
MKIIQPFDLTKTSIESLLNDKKILLAKDNKSWSASIFPLSKKLNNITTFDKDHIITQIDDKLFDDFLIADNVNQTIYNITNTKRDYIKCIEIGDINDSIKRYTQLNVSVDYNTDAQKFLNIPNQDYSQNTNLNISNRNIYQSEIDILMSKNKKNNIFDNNINHPHINQYNQSNNLTKNNNKSIIIQIFKWAKEKGIKYIYCINENRPNVINNQYVLPFVYYTIKGTYDKQNTLFNGNFGTGSQSIEIYTNIIDEFNNDIIDENNIELIY